MECRKIDLKCNKLYKCNWRLKYNDGVERVNKEIEEWE